jgi:hypothetical protein
MAITTALARSNASDFDRSLRDIRKIAFPTAASPPWMHRIGLRARAFCDRKIRSLQGHPSLGVEGGEWMQFRSLCAGAATLMLVSTLAVGCAKKEDGTATRAEQAAARSEDAARRAESAASRVEAAAQRAEAAAEKAERLFSKHVRK